MYWNLAVLAGFVFLYSVFAGRLERTLVGGAITYIAFGMVSGTPGLGILQLDVHAEGLRLLAELTLALVLFTDAANADLGVLRRSLAIPERLLLVGLPLTIALGFVLGVAIFDRLDLLEVALLATMLAPTDAALGKAVVTNPLVPAKIREGLNVESGLNDGICVPVLLLFLALAVGDVGEGSTTGLVLGHFAEQIGIGAVVGPAWTVLAAITMRFAVGRGWTSEIWLQIPVPALALLCFATAQATGGSGFIACFVGGLTAGALARRHKDQLLRSAEGIGDALALLTWVAFGAAVVALPRDALSWQVVLYALLSLTLVRMIPVLVCLTGTGLPFDTKLFIAWFGPRGLASIVFIIIVLDERLPGSATLGMTVVCTVLLSVLAHGLTANPFAAAFGSRSGTSLRGSAPQAPPQAKPAKGVDGDRIGSGQDFGAGR
jgi:NhaP-type Na+/H+ or K+/H+ antiporter